jgi:hypothetical protein
VMNRNDEMIVFDKGQILLCCSPDPSTLPYPGSEIFSPPSHDLLHYDQF